MEEALEWSASWTGVLDWSAGLECWTGVLEGIMSIVEHDPACGTISFETLALSGPGTMVLQRLL
jgi:hypothetical protein